MIIKGERPSLIELLMEPGRQIWSLSLALSPSNHKTGHKLKQLTDQSQPPKAQFILHSNPFSLPLPFLMWTSPRKVPPTFSTTNDAGLFFFSSWTDRQTDTKLGLEGVGENLVNLSLSHCLSADHLKLLLLLLLLLSSKAGLEIQWEKRKRGEIRIDGKRLWAALIWGWWLNQHCRGWVGSSSVLLTHSRSILKCICSIRP